jgi:hypothetical protein
MAGIVPAIYCSTIRSNYTNLVTRLWRCGRVCGCSWAWTGWCRAWVSWRCGRRIWSRRIWARAWRRRSWSWSWSRRCWCGVSPFFLLFGWDSITNSHSLTVGYHRFMANFIIITFCCGKPKHTGQGCCHNKCT